MRALRIAVLLIGLLFAAKAYPAENFFPCKASKTLMAEQMLAGYAFLATAVSSPGTVVQFYVNTRTGSWRMIGVDEALNACVILKGHGWQFAMLKEA